MVKVPSFFAGKRTGPSAENCAAKKTLVVVVRTGKLAPEIFRTNKESLETHVEGDMYPVFKEVNKEKSRLSMDEETMEDVSHVTLHQTEPAKEKGVTDAFEEEIREVDREIKKHDSKVVRPLGFEVSTGNGNLVSQACDGKLHQTGLPKEKLSAEAFEEEIRELDREIKKYDRKITGAPGFGVGTGKENFVSQPCIYESNVPCPTAHAANVLGPAVHATQLSLSTRMPLAEIPNSPVNHVHTEGTWKRVTRTGVACMVKTVGEKRRAENTINQTELPKKKKGF
nr:hypothetical protein CFP56_49278 [Quercus suber]